jgi:hypothetical protein
MDVHGMAFASSTAHPRVTITGVTILACIEISPELQAELMQSIVQLVVAAAGDKQRAAQLFAESLEPKGLGWLAQIVFDGIVKYVTPWHSGYNIEFAPAFTSKHRESE